MTSAGNVDSPATPDPAVLTNAVQLACRAPSVHNIQPWRWRAEGGALHLFVDRRRTVPATDHSGREVIISCGAVLDHLRVAMTAAGWRSNISRFPNPHDRDHLAAVEFSPHGYVTDQQRERADAILRRRTDRLPFGLPTWWHRFEPSLQSMADDDVVIIDVLPDELRPRLVAASQLTEALRRDDSAYHAELDWWTAPFRLDGGLPADVLVSDTERWRVDVGRDFPARNHKDQRPQVEVDRSKILVLATHKDTRTDVLRCGEALSTVLLECTMAGLATCPLSHLIELDQSRHIVRDLIDQRGEPQVLVRVGMAPPMANLPAPTPRRPLADILETR